MRIIEENEVRKVVTAEKCVEIMKKALLDLEEGRCEMPPRLITIMPNTAKFGFMPEDSPAYRDLAAQALLACLEVTPIVELNTGAMARGLRGSPYPHRFLLREILQHGGRMILSSDAHRRENLGFRFDDGLVLLRETGFRSVAVLHRGAFEDVGIEG